MSAIKSGSERGYSLRMGEELRGRIERVAREEGRSLNTEIVRCLERNYPGNEQREQAAQPQQAGQ